MSSKEIKKGTTILTEKPFAMVLKSVHRTTHCDNCFTSIIYGKVFKCPRCQYVHYCNRKCQKKSWSIHKAECAHLKNIPLNLWLDDARLMARIIIKLNQGEANKKGYYTKKNYKKFKDLMSNYTYVIADIKQMQHFTTMHRILLQLLHKTFMPILPELISIYGKLITNRFTITDNCLNDIGIGIYLGASVIDHSCQPNAIVIFKGTTIVVRTLTDLPSLDWSKCDCERCKKEEPMDEAAACPNSSCDAPCSIEVNECVKCGTKISADFKKTFREVVDFTTCHLEKFNISSQCVFFKMKKVFEIYQKFQKFFPVISSVIPSLDPNDRNNLQHLKDICKTCLEKQMNIMHKFNILHIYTLETIFSVVFTLSVFTEECWEDTQIYGKELLSGYLLYCGEVSPQTGILYLTMALTQLQLKKVNEALAALDKATGILMITFGDDYFELRDILKSLHKLLYRQDIHHKNIIWY